MNLSQEVERYRRNLSGYPPTHRGDEHGYFVCPSPCGSNYELRIISSGVIDPDWEHVSVSLANRCPNWKEMCYVKDLFWSEDETVIQFHPKKSEYVNNHPYCLHLWRNRTIEHELPPSILVGVK